MTMNLNFERLTRRPYLLKFTLENTAYFANSILEL